MDVKGSDPVQLPEQHLWIHCANVRGRFAYAIPTRIAAAVVDRHPLHLGMDSVGHS